MRKRPPALMTIIEAALTWIFLLAAAHWSIVWWVCVIWAWMLGLSVVVKAVCCIFSEDFRDCQAAVIMLIETEPKLYGAVSAITMTITIVAFTWWIWLPLGVSFAFWNAATIVSDQHHANNPNPKGAAAWPS